MNARALTDLAAFVTALEKASRETNVWIYSDLGGIQIRSSGGSEAPVVLRLDDDGTFKHYEVAVD